VGKEEHTPTAPDQGARLYAGALRSHATSGEEKMMPPGMFPFAPTEGGGLPRATVKPKPTTKKKRVKPKPKKKKVVKKKVKK